MKRNENSVENNMEKDKPIAKNSQLKKAVEEINNNSKQTEAIFGIHDDTNRVTHVKERFFRHFTFFDKVKLSKRQTNYRKDVE